MKIRKLFPVSTILALISINCLAEQSAEEVAKSLANPNTPLASLKFKFQYQEFEGDLPGAGTESSTRILFQPSLPFPLANGDKIIFRPAIPILMEQPVFEANAANFDSESGLGDTGYDLIYAQTSESGLLTGLGVVGSVPSATEDTLGNDTWTLGPEIFIGKISKTSVIGIFPTHQWNVGGSENVDVSLSSLQVFGVYLPGGGWNIGSSPTFSYDHERDQATVPVNLNFGKTIISGGRPYKLGVELNYYVEQPDQFGPDWMISFEVAPVVENAIAQWL